MRLSVFLLLLSAACRADERDFIASDYSDDTPAQIFALDPFEKPIGHSLVLSNVREKVAERFGQPRSIKERFELDRYGGEGAQIRYSTLQYRGLKVIVGDRPGSNGSWLVEIEVTDPAIRLKQQLGLGVTRTTVLDHLQPTSYLSEKHRLRISTDIWERRYADKPEDDSAQVNASVELIFDLDDAGHVIKFTWQVRTGH